MSVISKIKKILDLEPKRKRRAAKKKARRRQMPGRKANGEFKKKG
jgi:hypothetical protein